MTSNILFYLLIIISILFFIWDYILDELNYKHQQLPVPEILKNIYDNETNLKSKEYEKVKHQFSKKMELFSFTFSFIFFALKGYGWLDHLLRNYFNNEIIISLSFFGIIGFVSDLISTPFTYYSQFVIEERFGFNKSTIKTFILDKIKGYALTVIIGVPLYWLIVGIYYQNQSNFWWMSWILISLVTILAGTLYSTLILPIFNKLTPLPDGELKSAITSYCVTNNFSLKKVMIMDGSKRSTKANAFFTGIGRFKTIVLYDTLIEKLSTPEVIAVLAHEVGHYKKKHIITSMLIGILSTGISFYIFSMFLGNTLFDEALGGTLPCLHLEVIAISMVFSPVNLITGWLMNALSRKNEFEADNFAKQTSSGIDLANSLKKLSADALNALNPHPLYVKMHYSHPPLHQRLKNLIH